MAHDPVVEDFGFEGFADSADALGFEFEDTNKRRLQRAANIIARQIRSDFRRGGGREMWDAPAESTLESRRVKRTPPALTDTGRMMRAASANKPGVPGSAFSFEGHRIFMGVTEPEMIVHQTGSDNGHIPEREFLTIRAETASEIERAIGRDIYMLMRGASKGMNLR